MTPLRRKFLLAGAALVGTRISRGQVAQSFTLQFPPVTLDSIQPISIAAVASASCDLQVQLKGDRGGLLEPRKWTMEPKRAVSVLNQSLADLAGPAQVRAFVYPRDNAIPSVAIVLQQGTETDSHRLEKLAQRVPFIKDPAPRSEEGHHFTVDLKLESGLRLRIWRGENNSGPTVHDRRFSNLQPGENPIPWNLRNKNGRAVESGRYVATLLCTPTNSQRSPTYFFATFGVI
jgi:hypothetical protein